MNFDSYLDVLRGLPFILGAAIVAADKRDAVGQQVDAILELKVPTQQIRILQVEQKRGGLNRAMAERILSRMHADPPGTWILFAPVVTTALGHLLAESNINYVDEAGNCHLAIGSEYLAHVEGRKNKSHRTVGSGMGFNAYRLLFALMLREDLLHAPIRHIAQVAGLKKTTAADALNQLRRAGLVLESANSRQLRRTDVLDKWILGYSERLRPRLMIGRFEGPERDAEELTKRLEHTLIQTRITWAWGGGAAAYRLRRHFRGDETVLHVGAELAQPAPTLRVLPKEDGRLIVVRAPGPIAFVDPVEPHLAPPLLIYAELLLIGTERAREAAEQIRLEYLGDLS